MTEIVPYSIETFDSIWKQYASIAVSNGNFEWITTFSSRLDGVGILMLPLKTLVEEYRTPHFAVVALTVETSRDDRGELKYETQAMVSEYDTATGEVPIKQFKFTDIPPDFSIEMWLSVVDDYCGKLLEIEYLAEAEVEVIVNE